MSNEDKLIQNLKNYIYLDQPHQQLRKQESTNMLVSLRFYHVHISIHADSAWA